MNENIEGKLNFKTIDWRKDAVRLIDQRQLPLELSYFDCYETDDFVFAIKELVVRGAPAIGIAAAYGVALAAKRREDLKAAATSLKSSRPTAVNLAWAVDRMLDIARKSGNNPESLEREAIAIHQEDALKCRQIGQHGAGLIKDGANVLTHCNTGALATGGIGTALGAVYAAHFSGKRIHVWVDETRPVLQGARLTAWELGRAGVPHTLISDNMAASLMAKGKVDCVIVGADRIAANYDVANKIGTYNLAVICAYHKIPFYVAAPSTTFDSNCPDGAHIVVEERPAKEITFISGIQIAPADTAVYNPAFDITPHELITAIITENGVLSFRAIK
jgi:methylthioribose-1-phosphate isomerase